MGYLVFPHAKDAKGGKGGLRDEGVKGLRKCCDLSDRGVRFGIRVTGGGDSSI